MRSQSPVQRTLSISRNLTFGSLRGTSAPVGALRGTTHGALPINVWGTWGCRGTPTTLGTDHTMFEIDRKMFGIRIDRSMFEIDRIMFGIDRTMFGIDRTMFGIDRKPYRPDISFRGSKKCKIGLFGLFWTPEKIQGLNKKSGL